jgi:hypothetical protein
MAKGRAMTNPAADFAPGIINNFTLYYKPDYAIYVLQIGLTHILRMTEKTSLTFRLTAAEANILFGYARRAGRTQSDVLREFIRSLERRELKRPGPAKEEPPGGQGANHGL